eukprot:CAMPEP_0184694194 /NCGR_PEP_ID=MMETSP0313-20130426/2234_1 /TAXON_ID=2792 /ORGANISM="Porphyridium aerugineum, Strain SAG 1380-2" /LENGTH=508 /DNA_ID=CAMNT_0027152445 /DNA_START=84 /DNA_END=1606 /DNA_ORIENTATION=-
MAQPIPNGAASTVNGLANGLANGSAKKYQIVFVTAEVAPWSQTGGLGAVADGLPIELAKMGHRVMSISPRYDQYADAWDTSFIADVNFGPSKTQVRYFHAYKQRVDRVFVDHPVFLEKVWGLTKDRLYGPKWGVDYEDNQMRFAMFSEAVLKAVKGLSLGGYTYGEDVIIICNDWHSSLLPMYLKLAREAEPEAWRATKTVFCAHNMVYQGRFPLRPEHAKILNLPQYMIDDMSCFMPLRVGKKHPRVSCLNWMLGGFKYADKLATVSPQYAHEIESTEEKGVELEKIATAHGGVTGILNGLKDNVDPMNKDMKSKGGLASNFDTSSLANKKLCKAALQEKMKLPVKDVPLFCFLGRLDVQKGVDVMLNALDTLLETEDIQIVMMGGGNEEMVEKALSLKKAFPTKYVAVLSFKGAEKYQVYAGADYALMPSRYEPCGLVQMESMRFGTVPIVSPTGGLLDTVQDMKSGIVLSAELDPESDILPEDVEKVADGIKRAIKLYKSQDQLT